MSRRYVRVPTDAPALIVSSGRPVRGRLHDLSRAGLGFIAEGDPGSLKRRARVELDVHLSRRAYHLTGRIVWLREQADGAVMAGVELDREEIAGYRDLLRWIERKEKTVKPLEQSIPPCEALECRLAVLVDTLDVLASSVEEGALPDADATRIARAAEELLRACVSAGVSSTSIRT